MVRKSVTLRSQKKAATEMERAAQRRERAFRLVLPLALRVAGFLAWCSKVWRNATWWQSYCTSCMGSGVCLENSAVNRVGSAPHPSHPHPCCGPCGRRAVPAAAVSPGFLDTYERDGRLMVTIGTGKLYYRPWAPGRVHPERPA